MFSSKRSNIRVFRALGKSYAVTKCLDEKIVEDSHSCWIVYIDGIREHNNKENWKIEKAKDTQRLIYSIK